MKMRFTPYDAPLAVFLLSAWMGIFAAYDRSLSLATLAFLLCGGLLYALISRLANTPRRWELAAYGLAAATALVGVYYVSQLGHMGMAGKIPALMRIAGWIARFTPNLALWKPIDNTIGTFLEGGVFLLFGLAIIERRPLRRAVLTASLALSGMGLLFSASRGAWLAVFAAAMLWAALRWKPARWIGLALSAGLAGLVLYALASGGTSAFESIPAAGGVLGVLFDRPDRLEVYRNSLALLRDVPFTGIGLGGQFAMVYSRYALLLHVPFLYYAHNLYLDIWLEQGLVGIAAWIWLAVSILTAVGRRKAVVSPDDRIRFEATWIGLTAVLIHGLTDARQTQALLAWLPFFTLLGLNAALILRAPEPAEAHSARVRYLPLAASAAFLIAVLAAAWPLPAAVRVNQAALLQHRADLSRSMSQPQRSALLDRAEILLEEALETDPGNRSANQRLGMIALSRQDFHNALFHLRTAHEADPLHPATRRALGLAYTFSGKLEEAAPLLRGQLNIVEELNFWGQHYSSNHSIQLGRNAYQLSLILQPNQPEILECVQDSLLD